jgi:CcmD family protein
MKALRTNVLRISSHLQKGGLALVLAFLSAALQAQPAVEMADQFRADGKIRVVVGVIVIIFVGLLVYMIRLDRKVKKMEEDNAPS